MARDRILCELLDESQLDRLHEATLQVLERTGVRFSEKAAQEIFRDAGFQVAGDGTTLLPPARVEQLRKKTPKTFTRLGSDPSCTVPMGTQARCFGVGSLPIRVLDVKTGEHRDARYGDMEDFSFLGSELENFDISNASVQALDVPEEHIHLEWLRVQYTHSRKPFCCWYAKCPEIARDTIAVASAAQGGIEEVRRTNTIVLTATQEKGLWWGDSIHGLIEFAKAGLAVELMPMPMPGSMHPVTLAGAIVQCNAEILAAVCLAQIIRPGTPLIYGPYSGTLEMRTGAHTFGNAEVALMTAAWTQLSRRYEIPNDMVVATSDSKVLDEQNAYEKMMTNLLPALAGCDSLSMSGGMFDFALTASLAQLVIDNDMIGHIKRILRGIEITDETLGLDVIDEVCPGGHYLAHEHTLRNFRNEIHISSLRDCDMRSRWAEKGAKDIVERAREKALEILGRERPCPIPESRRQDMETAINDIKRRIRLDGK